MGDSLHPLGPRLGRLHAWRERGGTYVDGLRTSAQFAFIAAGVAKGADFTGTAWAVTLGLAIFIGIEGGKIFAGWLDDRFDVWRSHTQAVAEQNPVVMRQLEALERLSPARPAILPTALLRDALELGPSPVEVMEGVEQTRRGLRKALCACSRKFTKHQTGCAQKIEGQPIGAVNLMLLR